MGVGEEVLWDPFSFRKHFKNIGRAYREQATTLIAICRLYVETYPQTYTKDDGIQNVLRLADAALSAAGRAKKSRTSEATDAFLRVQEEINRYGSLSPRKNAPGDHRKELLDPSTALESALKKDEKSMSTLSKVKSAFKAPLPSGHTKIVDFLILESPHRRRKDQLIIHQEIDNSTTTTEIVWRFSRYPEKSARVTPRQNPHFYLQLSEDAASFDREFHKDPLTGFSHGLMQGDAIYVLLDKSCRLFLDTDKPRIFGNLWKPHQTVILKDVGGVLDSEDIVLEKIGESQDYWHRPSITDSSQRRVQSGYAGGDSDIVDKLVGNLNGRALVDAALRSQNVDLMIRDRSRPDSIPPADSGWKPLPSPEPPSVRVQEPEDQTTSTTRQSATTGTRLPQLEYSNPNASVPSIDSSTLFATSTESFGTVVNAPEVPLSMRAAAGKLPQFVDSAIDLQVELPPTAADTFSTPPPSAPPASLMIPSPLPGQDREPLSAPPVPVRKWGARGNGNWFQRYIYDYDSESWRSREPQ